MTPNQRRGDPNFKVVKQWLGWSHDPGKNQDRVYAIALLSNNIVISVWGRRGASYESLPKRFTSWDAAQSFYYSKIQEKQRGTSSRQAYVQVPFNDHQYGNVPRFDDARNHYVDVDDSGTALQRDTINSVYLNARLYRIRGMVLNKANSDFTLISFRQASLECEVWGYTAPDAEKKPIFELMDAVELEVKRYLIEGTRR